MIAFIGLILTFIMVFGGYLLAGGKLGIILKSLPFEMMMIGGAAVGSFALSNSLDVCKSTAKDLKRVFKGSRWSRDNYLDVLRVLHLLLNIAKKHPVELEQHLDNPLESKIFERFPKLLSDHGAVDMICDTLRAVSMNFDNPMEIEDLLEIKVEEQRHHQEHSSHSLQTVADALPALGIVAAVLGVIKTMASIDQPPEVLGKLIGGALVGTFLGVFLAYCVVAPFAAKIKAVSDEDVYFYKVIKDTLVAYVRGHPTKMCLEVARQGIPVAHRPSFDDLELAIKES